MLTALLTFFANFKTYLNDFVTSDVQTQKAMQFAILMRNFLLKTSKLLQSSQKYQIIQNLVLFFFIRNFCENVPDSSNETFLSMAWGVG